MGYNNKLHNKKVLITAGPTREAIDPVRYVSDYSSGKLGFAIAQTFLEKGAQVCLVSGPVSLQLQHPRLKLIKVNSASEMYLACCHYFEDADIAVFTAEVADYRPEKVAEKKIKNEELHFTIKMVKNIDIAYEFGLIKNHKQISVGFTRETDDEIKHAIGKLDKKSLDMIVLNAADYRSNLSAYHSGSLTIIKNDFSKKSFPQKNTIDVANEIVNEVAAILLAHEKYQLEESVLDYEMMYR